MIKKLTDKVGLIEAIPKEITIWLDTGSIRIQHIHPNCVFPDKARKNCPLNSDQKQNKQNNWIISSIRVISEHAIGGIKRFKATSDICRNKLPNMDDTMSCVCVVTLDDFTVFVSTV